MNQIFATVIALAAIAGTTVYEGIRFEFWTNIDPEVLNRFAENLKAVPESFGDWSSEPAAVDETQMAAAEIVAHVSRDYVNRKTGAKVNVFLVCGKTHPMAIHSPDQCYAAAGFKQGDANRKYIPLEGKLAELWSSQFTRNVDIERHVINIMWSWAADDGLWQAPTNPRPHFSNKDVLYKIYLITQPGNEGAADEFLTEFLPLLDKVLFVPAGGTSEQKAETNG